MHSRTLIRKAAAEAVQDHADAVVGLKLGVFAARTVKKFSASELPACTVVTSSEDIENDKLKVELSDKQRVLALSIAVVTGAGSEEQLSDDLDTLAELVELAIESDRSLGGTASDTLYSGCELYDDEEGNAYRKSLLLKYVVIYQYAPAPDASDLSPLLQANVEWNLRNAQAEADRVTDVIPVEQDP